MGYRIKQSDYDDPIFNLSYGGFLKKYRKQIGESNLDRNVKNYIIDNMSCDYKDRFKDRYKYLVEFIIKYIEFIVFNDKYGKSYAWYLCNYYRNNIDPNFISENGYYKFIKDNFEYAKDDAYDNFEIIYGKLYSDDHRITRLLEDKKENSKLKRKIKNALNELSYDTIINYQKIRQLINRKTENTEIQVCL